MWRLIHHLAPSGEVLFQSARVRVDPWRRAALAEVERLSGQAMVAAPTESAGGMTVTSVLRGRHFAVVTVDGLINREAVGRLAAHLAGLLNTGARHFVVDVSRAVQVDHSLLDLMRGVEARTAARGGVFELTGLTPPVLHAMDDEPLDEVFALYRATLDEDDPHATPWAAVRCPEGLGEVPEPRTPARHRSIIDVGATP
jgi:anti-anti-sigma regulatory factor